MKDTSKLKSNLKQALSNVPDEFSFLEIKQFIKTALVRLEKIEQKKAKKEKIKQKKKETKIYSPNSLQIIERMIKEEEKKLKNKNIEKEENQTWYG